MEEEREEFYERTRAWRERIVKPCKKCSGQGVIPVEDGIDDLSGERRCDCYLEWRRVCERIRARIPEELWDYNQIEVAEENRETLRIVEHYCRHLHKAREHGLGFFLTGKGVLAKSAAASRILDAAIRAGYSSFYLTISDFLDFSYSKNEETREWFRGKSRVDFLVLEGLGRERFSDRIIETIEAFVGLRRSLSLPVIISSVLSYKVFLERYGEGLASICQDRARVAIFRVGDKRRHTNIWEEVMGE